MANNDFIISTLNISAQQLRSVSIVKKDQKFYIQVELVPEYPECPFCGAKSKSKIIPGINTITWISPVFHL